MLARAVVRDALASRPEAASARRRGSYDGHCVPIRVRSRRAGLAQNPPTTRCAPARRRARRRRRPAPRRRGRAVGGAALDQRQRRSTFTAERGKTGGRCRRSRRRRRRRRARNAARCIDSRMSPRKGSTEGWVVHRSHCNADNRTPLQPAAETPSPAPRGIDFPCSPSRRKPITIATGRIDDAGLRLEAIAS